MKTIGGTHAQRLSNWRNLAPPQTRALIDGVLEGLVPCFEAQGFGRVDYSRIDGHSPISGSKIHLERIAADHIDSVTFNFEKYRSPRVQIQISQRELSPPHKFIRSANLVRRSSQYYCFWGKPWWLPTRLWSTSATQRALQRAKQCLGQATQFLESGERGSNISRQVNAQPLPSRLAPR
jgi:hypothetical protein